MDQPHGFMVPFALSGCGTDSQHVYPEYGWSYQPHDSGCQRCKAADAINSTRGDAPQGA